MNHSRKQNVLAQEIHDFLMKDYTSPGPAPSRQQDSPWRTLRDIGTELWLDTGNFSEIESLWQGDFTAVTTNNTLLNREVQSGQYDQFIMQAYELIDRHDLDEKTRRLEFAFMLNAHHGLRLVEKFGAFVSVEEHTDLADNVELALEYARRYYALCPDRFYVKIPLTPAGLLAARFASRETIPVNLTLGFSARQNYLAARIAQPEFVNVFLGRLGSFVDENKLGSGKFVGENATIASQAAIRELRSRHKIMCRQIAASFRNADQVRNLAGADVMTMPAKVAQEYVKMGFPADEIKDRTSDCYDVQLNPGVNEREVRIDTLWEISDRFKQAVDELAAQNLDKMQPDDLVEFLSQKGCGDVLPKWTDEQIGISKAEGKIPLLDNWRKELGGKVIGLDSLLNLAGLCSFKTDQNAMDQRVEQVLHEMIK